MSTSATRIRTGAAALAAAGVLFLAYPVLRPWHDEGTVAGATASMSSTAWVAAHFFAMLGFILIPLGLLALRGALAATRAEPLALTAAVLAWIGSGLVLPYYGAEDFGLHAIAGSAGPGAGSIILAAALWASAGRPRAAVTPLADRSSANVSHHRVAAAHLRPATPVDVQRQEPARLRGHGPVRNSRFSVVRWGAHSRRPALAKRR